MNAMTIKIYQRNEIARLHKACMIAFEAILNFDDPGWAAADARHSEALRAYDDACERFQTCPCCDAGAGESCTCSFHDIHFVDHKMFTVSIPGGGWMLVNDHILDHRFFENSVFDAVANFILSGKGKARHIMIHESNESSQTKGGTKMNECLDELKQKYAAQVKYIRSAEHPSNYQIGFIAGIKDALKIMGVTDEEIKELENE